MNEQDIKKLSALLLDKQESKRKIGQSLLADMLSRDIHKRAKAIDTLRDL